MTNHDENDLGSIDLGNLSIVSILRLKAAFLQMASDAREADDTGSEEFLTALAGILETSQARTVTAMFRRDGPMN